MQAEDIRSLQETERLRLAVNKQVVRLLQQKTVPLNRGRYLHLQKISRAVVKDTALRYASSAQFTLLLPPPALSPLPHPNTSNNRPMAVANLLLERLSGIKTQKCASQENIAFNPVHLYTRVVQTEITPVLKHSLKTPKSQGRRRRENLLELAERAEKYLRVKKRDLKERHSKDRHQKDHRKKAGVQRLLTTFQSPQKKQGGMSNKKLERELLQDFREEMLQERMNRMKREINHKKIVQMR